MRFQTTWTIPAFGRIQIGLAEPFPLTFMAIRLPELNKVILAIVEPRSCAMRLRRNGAPRLCRSLCVDHRHPDRSGYDGLPAEETVMAMVKLARGRRLDLTGRARTRCRCAIPSCRPRTTTI